MTQAPADVAPKQLAELHVASTRVEQEGSAAAASMA
jgi:hypothetical protein